VAGNGRKFLVIFPAVYPAAAGVPKGSGFAFPVFCFFPFPAPNQAVFRWFPRAIMTDFHVTEERRVSDA